MSTGLDDRVKNLEEALAITKGRVDGMHALLLTIARHPDITALLLQSHVRIIYIMSNAVMAQEAASGDFHPWTKAFGEEKVPD